MRVVFEPFSQGDYRVVGIRITPRQPFSPPGPAPTVVSGSWTAVEALTGSPVGSSLSPSSGSLVVNATIVPYSFIATVPITWSTAGNYVVRFDLLWSDSTQDNTLNALITVNAPAV